MMNIGFRPTLAGEERSFEVHTFDFEGNLCQNFRYRGTGIDSKEKKFDSLESLKEQLQQDKQTCKALIPSK